MFTAKSLDKITKGVNVHSGEECAPPLGSTNPRVWGEARPSKEIKRSGHQARRPSESAVLSQPDKGTGKGL